MTNFVFGTWLKQLRQQLGFSRQQVCDQSEGKISQQYIHFIESGRATNIGSDKLEALAQGLRIPIEVLEEALFRRQEPKIHLVGRVSAGQEASIHWEEYVPQEFVPYLRPEQQLFAVEVIGDSMSPKLEHGDLAIAKFFQPNEPIIEGGIYLIRHRGKMTCKYLVKNLEDGSGYRLLAENPDLFPPTPLNEKYELVGRVIEVRKTHSLLRPVLKS